MFVNMSFFGHVPANLFASQGVVWWMGRGRIRPQMEHPKTRDFVRLA